MEPVPPLTLLLGPQTTVSLGLNDLARAYRHAFPFAGMTVLPSRIASPLIRRCLDDRPLTERRAELASELTDQPVFLSAVNFFGPPEAGLMRRELFPDIEVKLAGLAELAPGVRIVLAIDPLPEFFLAAGSEGLEARVRATGWEHLYEISWADLVREVAAMLPGSPILVLTGKGVGAATEEVQVRLFGEAARALDGQPLLKQLINATGRAVLGRMDTAPDAATQAELFTSFAAVPGAEDVVEKLGIDKVTRVLMNQRFAEDLTEINTMAGVEVI